MLQVRQRQEQLPAKISKNEHCFLCFCSSLFIRFILAGSQHIQQMNGDRESNEDPPSSVDRPTKRVKTSAECADTATLTAPPSLPPDAWAAVMECLKLSDVLSLSCTCRAIYHDAVPLVTTLHITKPRQMDPFLSKRFTDIRDIYIYSLLNRQPDYKYDVDFETSVRVATFLSNNFAKAERVFIVCISYGDPYIHWDTVKNSADNRIKISNLIESFSTGFRSRALSPTLSIRGLRCLRLQSFSHNDCQVCRRACESFPLEAVARFECRGSSKIQARSSRPYDLDVCLGRETVVRTCYNNNVLNPWCIFSDNLSLTLHPLGGDPFSTTWGT